MKINYLAFIISFLAGISTIIGYLPTYISKKHQDKVIVFSLSFSSGIMLMISLFSLIPESYHYLSSHLSFPIIMILAIYINTGIILSLFIDKKIDNLVNDKLYKLGLLSIITMILHNIPEGIITYLTTSVNLKLGLTLSIAIALHNIPEGIAISVPIYYSTKSRKKAFLYTLISGFSEFLGAMLAHLFLKRILTNYLLSFLLAITSGIMLHLSIFNLLPNSISYHQRKTTILGIITSIIMIIIYIKVLHIT